MPYGYSSDPDIDRSTNRVMLWGALLLLAMILVFPLYLNFEPDNREESRTENLASLASQGETIWEANCSTCHGVDGEGVSAPALNSKQFLQEASDEQIFHLVSVGVPGTAMAAFGQDLAGPLTSEQVEAATAYIRAWEKEAPDRPDWRTAGQG